MNSSQKKKAAGDNDRDVFSDGQINEVHTQLMREKSEPREGFNRMPAVVAAFIGALGMWCCWYFYENNFNMDSSVFDIYAAKNKSAGAGVPVVETLEMRVKKGEKLFYQQCATCHQPDGRGMPGTYPPLAGSPFVVGDDARAISIVLVGLTGEIEVLGKKYNNTMADVGRTLKDKQVADILTFVRQAWSNNAGAVSPEKVAEIRKELGARGAWSVSELLKAHPLESE